jgi:flagellar biosynthesis regulator FlaF
LRGAGPVGRFGEKRPAYRSLMDKAEGTRQLDKSRHKSEDIKTYIKEIGWEGVVWIHLAQDRDK